MSLFNATIQQLTLSINEVLTECYLHIYGRQTFGSKRQRETQDTIQSNESGDSIPAKWGAPFDKSTRVELVLLTSPLSATDEIINVYSAGLADFELAAPIVLASIGASNADVLNMMDRFKTNKSTMSANAHPKDDTESKAVGKNTGDGKNPSKRDGKSVAKSVTTSDDKNFSKSDGKSDTKTKNTVDGDDSEEAETGDEEDEEASRGDENTEEEDARKKRKKRKRV